MRTIVFACVLLTGCAGMGWYKPGATESDFYADRAACDAESYARYPVQQMTSGGYTPPAMTTCRNAGFGQVQCTTTQQPTMYQTTTDVNVSGRNMAFASCMRGRGYTFKIGG